jgi:hypothetical protein
VAFFTARPTLELIADEVAAGQKIVFPQRAGLFRVVGSYLDEATSSVGLMIGPTGFVRVCPGAPTKLSSHPIIGTEVDVDLGGGWWYREDD